MSTPEDAQQVIDNPAERRFEIQIDGHLAVAEYVLSPGRIVFTHTLVPEALQGRGLGSRLARAALEHARAHQLGVVPLCPFIRSYIERHPEYQPLVVQPQQS